MVCPRKFMNPNTSFNVTRVQIDNMVKNWLQFNLSQLYIENLLSIANLDQKMKTGPVSILKSDKLTNKHSFLSIHIQTSTTTFYYMRKRNLRKENLLRLIQSKKKQSFKGLSDDDNARHRRNRSWNFFGLEGRLLRKRQCLRNVYIIYLFIYVVISYLVVVI